MLKNKLAHMQHKTHYTEQLLPAVKRNEWNDALLGAYYHAFSTGLVDATEIYSSGILVWSFRILK
ncbi:hypothetical protein CWS02_13915 [Enterobacter sp. EA-1]|nr:hypothetical protein CWS02_13915 [Enterobacter sp. EA-1]